MMEAAFQGDLARTSRILYGFQNEGVEPMAIYGAIMWNIRQLAGIAGRISAGESVEKALSSQWGSSAQRKHALKKILERHTSVFLQRLLVSAGKIDRVIKGDDRPLTWCCFHELMTSLVQNREYNPELINTLTA